MAEFSGDHKPVGVNAAAATILAHDRKRRKHKHKHATAGKKEKRDKEPTPGSDKATIAQVLTPEAQRHGKYRWQDFTLRESVDSNGKLRLDSIRVIRNAWGTVITRWLDQKHLDQRQVDAINFYISRHKVVFGTPQQSMDWTKFMASTRSTFSPYAEAKAQALDDLKRLDREVFKRERPEHFDIWQNVVLHDEPAGKAGSTLLGARTRQQREDRAKFIVCDLAWKIANLVIDPPRSRLDYGRLAVDPGTSSERKRTA